MTVTEGKTMRELRAIVARDQMRWAMMGKLWDELTYEYQDELIGLAAKRAAELDALDRASA